MQLSKQAVDEGLERSFDDALGLEHRLLREAISSPNFAEGALAFLEKRDPVWVVD